MEGTVLLTLIVSISGIGGTSSPPIGYRGRNAHQPPAPWMMAPAPDQCLTMQQLKVVIPLILQELKQSETVAYPTPPPGPMPFGSEQPTSGMGAMAPDTDTMQPGMGSMQPGLSSVPPYDDSITPELGSVTPGTGSRRPVMSSMTPGMGSRKPGIGSRQPGIDSMIPRKVPMPPTTTPSTPPDVLMESNRYKLFPQMLNWEEALEYCQVEGMQLATVRSYEDEMELLGLLQNHGAVTHLWTAGITDPFLESCSNQDYYWLTYRGPEPMTYQSWHDHQPDTCEKCVQYWSSGGTWGWDDTGCQYEKMFACEHILPPSYDDRPYTY